VEDPAGQAERRRAPVLVVELRLAHLALEPDAVLEAELGDPRAESRAGVVVRADDHGLERDAATVELAARVDHDVEALLLHEAPDPEKTDLPVGAGRRRGSLLSHQP